MYATTSTIIFIFPGREGIGLNTSGCVVSQMPTVQEMARFAREHEQNTLKINPGCEIYVKAWSVYDERGFVVLANDNDKIVTVPSSSG